MKLCRNRNSIEYVLVQSYFSNPVSLYINFFRKKCSQWFLYGFMLGYKCKFSIVISAVESIIWNSIFACYTNIFSIDRYLLFRGSVKSWCDRKITLYFKIRNILHNIVETDWNSRREQRTFTVSYANPNAVLFLE